MKVAIMQPYLFPYLGYWQLIKSVDTFVILDDVNFIKRGYINRNSILVNNNVHMFSVPICFGRVYFLNVLYFFEQKDTNIHPLSINNMHILSAH